MAGLTACGAPQYTYVTDSAAKAYFKVPYGWHPISQSALAQALKTGGTSVWVSAFGANPGQSPRDIFSFDVSQPFVFAEVGTLNSTASASLSYNGLTDIFLPVTSQARSAESGALPMTNFQLLRQAMLTPGSHGVHGVRVTYEYTYQDGTADTFDQVALTNADQTRPQGVPAQRRGSVQPAGLPHRVAVGDQALGETAPRMRHPPHHPHPVKPHAVIIPPRPSRALPRPGKAFGIRGVSDGPQSGYPPCCA